MGLFDFLKGKGSEIPQGVYPLDLYSSGGARLYSDGNWYIGKVPVETNYSKEFEVYKSDYEHLTRLLRPTTHPSRQEIREILELREKLDSTL